MALKKIRFMDTSFRDGFQSVYGARVITKDFIPAFEASLEAGIDHYEFGGGARFQSLFFYTQENAFDMMDTLRKIAGDKVNLQTLARGINVVGLAQQPKDIIELHAKLFKKHGTSTIRNFDALNDMQNLDYSGRCIHKQGLHHQISIALMGLPPGIKDTTVHTAEFYTEKVKEILERNIPFDSIVFKDASGTTPPQIVKDTIKKTRDILGKDKIIWFHTHDTAGLGTTAIMAAVEAGADGIDLSKSPVSGGTCQPDILTIWAAFRNTEFTLDIDYKKILRAERAFEDAMSSYLLPPESRETSPLIVLSPMPGGALTANTMMMRDTNTLHLYPRVIEEMAEVVARGGFGTSVTPVSQFYFQQAYMNVVMGKWKKITDGYGNMVLGYFGKTPRPADPEIVKIASEQLKKEPFEGNPVDILKPGIGPAKQVLTDNNLPVTDENIFIIATCKDKGLEYLKGNSTLSVYYKEDKKDQKSVPTNTPTVKSSQSIENLIVNVNGKDYRVSVKPDDGTGKPVIQHQPAQVSTPKPAQTPQPVQAKPVSAGAETIKAPLHGVVLKVLVKEGQQVNADQAIVILEAMKMENEIYAHKQGIIKSILIKEGDSVEEGKDLIVIE
ncbi:MAG: biotin/lipoyl-binding protein [Candidatus Cloacimonetes bacterium]|jgi:pyruvate carboxylase subunit B|nr:biotin/lipoyl-binding protein [Candidatus Cloacimonadota bacterium]